MTFAHFRKSALAGALGLGLIGFGGAQAQEAAAPVAYPEPFAWTGSQVADSAYTDMPSLRTWYIFSITYSKFSF